jgi:ribosome biogenesis SPOUT family RNA methylase Rps3
MITNAFEAILKELGDSMKIEKIQPDEHNSCLLQLKDEIQIQIEPDTTDDWLIMGCKLGHIPPGTYRTQLFKAALQTNGLAPASIGTFAWSEHADLLVLFVRIPVKHMDGIKLHEILTKLHAKALIWKKAIEEHKIPMVESETNKIIASRGGLFGLRP